MFEKRLEILIPGAHAWGGGGFMWSFHVFRRTMLLLNISAANTGGSFRKIRNTDIDFNHIHFFDSNSSKKFLPTNELPFKLSMKNSASKPNSISLWPIPI